jgi:hypothetical protein
MQLCVPLFLPLGLELGSFILLALGLAPRRREIAIEPIGAPTPTDATPMQADAKRSQTVAKIMQEAAKPAAGTRAYYLTRLQREFPKLAMQVASGDPQLLCRLGTSRVLRALAKRAWNASDYADSEIATA